MENAVELIKSAHCVLNFIGKKNASSMLPLKIYQPEIAHNDKWSPRTAQSCREHKKRSSAISAVGTYILLDCSYPTYAHGTESRYTAW